ncbi:tRNA uracil 4-sulfurtransferase ThiI [Aquibacillus rhizosphaerae]|uniref:Probable tRNA sulfurtransferase n=1 Tax=Aquibacillus rhizosphaerae TaxID=3051431 RepID=A0ABT7L648_9BACI|nr:tRNA uracil 4-sulfurtransferase ThiI [Aquibacillus sp. LR5S19]MDL4841343.1 tRNA uracil 4-sulfurtransferase ThiI [Aquibacillus sp. LR5S19]
MDYDHIIVRYGELALKGRNRKIFTNKLHENVARKLKDHAKIKIKKTRDRMYIILNGEDPNPIIDKCKVIFGIQSLSVAIKVENDPDKIKESALFALREAEKVKTFKITAKRVDKNFPIGSQEFNHVVGGYILSSTTGYTVDVHNPDIELHIEIRNEATYITSKRILGAGGLPVGSSGKTLLLLSGGIDSPVAGYLAMKRGVQIEAIHFHSPPYTSDRAKQKVFDLAEKLTNYGDKIKIHVVPFTKLQQKIHRDIPYGYSMTVMRRMMMKISEQIARNEGILSLTTGESLGQVASQTMESMHAINEVTNYPIIRPLITMDKTEIMHISENINAYEISIRPYEDCCTVFVPASPKTKPKTDKVVYFESNYDYQEEIEEAIKNKETVEITQENNMENEFIDLL